MGFPRVIFVEGPTGVGKGYFIGKLKELLGERHPDLEVKVLEAKQWALKESARSEDRKYTSYNTKPDAIDVIVDGHLRLIGDLSDLVEERENTVWIVDRSYLSCICYNLYQDHQYALRAAHTARFLRWFKNFLVRHAETLAVVLDTGQDLLTTVQTLEERVRVRTDNKPVDRSWLNTIIQNYTLFTPEEYLPCDHIERVTSSDSLLILEKYFNYN